MRFVREVDAGNLHVNWTPLWRADLMPYGGLKGSGIGKEGPRYAVEGDDRAEDGGVPRGERRWVVNGETVRLTTAQAIVRYLQAQWSERDGDRRRLIPTCGGSSATAT